MTSFSMSSGSATFIERLTQAIVQKGTPLMVGLDPRANRLPDEIAVDLDLNDIEKVAEAYTAFCCGIIDIVAPLVPAVKPQAAFFEQCGPAGMQAMADIIRHAKSAGLLVVLDGKRNDIGATAEAYARAYLGEHPHSAWGCDALTVNPYMGDDSLEPMVQQALDTGSGIFVLVKTSNTGSHTFQELDCNGEPLYCKVASWVQQRAEQSAPPDSYGVVGAVVGATFPEHLVELRQRMPNSWFLIPGYGAQGGQAADIAPAFDKDGLGAIVNSSRQIIFAYQQTIDRQDPRWQESIEQATRQAMEDIRAVLPAKSDTDQSE